MIALDVSFKLMTRLWIAAFITCAFVSGCSREAPAPSSGAQPADAASPAAAPPPASEPISADEQAADDQATLALKKWTGDLDGMIERRMIRVLTTYSKT